MMCRECLKRMPIHNKRRCEYCLTRENLIYHRDSLLQVTRWAQDIFLNGEVDGMIKYHKEMFEMLSVVMKIMISQDRKL